MVRVQAMDGGREAVNALFIYDRLSRLSCEVEPKWLSFPKR